MNNDLKILYEAVKTFISKVRCEDLWYGFRPLRFALYNDTECFFDGAYIEKTDRFLGNTSIEYNGEFIAIWYVTDASDPAILASKMIHEMFHGFQNSNHDSRFPNELQALYHYRYSSENLSIKLEENRLLCELTEVFDCEKLRQFLRCRKYRAIHFRYEFTYESQVEQIEGTANYIELQALKQISPPLYRRKLAQMKDNITKPQNLLPIRILSYDTGALLLHILKENSIPFDQDFSDTAFSENLIREVEAAEPCGINDNVTAAIDTYFADAQTIIDRAIAKNEVVMACRRPLLGVNFYNAVYLNGYITSTYFVMHGDESAPSIEHGDFVIETPEEGLITKLYKMT